MMKKYVGATLAVACLKQIRAGDGKRRPYGYGWYEMNEFWQR